MEGRSGIELNFESLAEVSGSLVASSTSVENVTVKLQEADTTLFASWTGTGAASLREPTAALEQALNRIQAMMDAEACFVDAVVATMSESDHAAASSIASG